MIGRIASASYAYCSSYGEKPCIETMIHTSRWNSVNLQGTDVKSFSLASLYFLASSVDQFRLCLSKVHRPLLLPTSEALPTSRGTYRRTNMVSPKCASNVSLRLAAVLAIFNHHVVGTSGFSSRWPERLLGRALASRS